MFLRLTKKLYICKTVVNIMKHLLLFRWLIAAAFLFVFLQIYYSFHFYYIEQNQLFLLSWNYVLNELLEPGGFSLIISEFLVQFFILPYAGAAVTSLLLIGAGMVFEQLLKHMFPGKNLFLLSLFLPLALLFAHFDFNYFTQGTVSFLLMLAALLACGRIADSKVRLVVSCLMAPLLFVVAGPVSVLFAGCLFLIELLKRSSRSYLFICPLIVAVFLSLLSVYYSVEGDFRFAFLPDAYYHSELKPKEPVYLAWLVLPLILLFVYFVRDRKLPGRKSRAFAVLIQLLLLTGSAYWGIKTYGELKSSLLKELDYYARTEQWNRIVGRCQGKVTNYLYMNYLNMSLAQKGMLGDQMFAFDQRDPRSLLVNANRTAAVSTLLSDVYFAMGDVASAQQMAFEGYVAAPGYGNPRLLKRLVQTNLIFGAYPVAEKYISLLEKTFFYSKWASEQRKFLWKDDLVAGDALLGKMRKCLPGANHLMSQDGPLSDMEAIAVANPESKAAFHYMAGACLLSKDLQKFKQLMDTYYGTPVLPVLPVPYQEAVITFAEQDTAYWHRFNISNDVVIRFSEYKRQVLANRSYPNVSSVMAASYGKTYWYFYMFK